MLEEKTVDETKAESLGQELSRMQNEFEVTTRPQCHGKSSLIAGNGLSNTAICLIEQNNEVKQIELIVQQKKALKPTKCSPPKRYIFTLMGCFGMIMLYALRVNLSVAIVSMVKSSSTIKPFEMTAIEGEFDWDEKAQALVLGSFFWGYVVFQLPGGRLADSLGSKWLLGSGILMTALLTIVSPIAARWHYSLFIVCRILEGVFEGCVIPAMHSMIAKWFPPYERSTTAGIIYSGSMIGTVISMPTAAMLCTTLGWAYAFYFFGLAGIIWSVLWFYLISETPQEHPTISQQELRTILTSQNHNSSKKKPNIPWKSILTSVPLWALTTAHFGQNWGFYTLLTQMPRYFKELGFDLKSNGFFSALPYLSQAMVASSMGFVCDWLYRTDRFALPTLRKSFNSIAFLGTATFMFLITLIGRDRLLNIVLLVLALGINGMSMAGFTVTHVDMSPNFAGTLMGITNCVANFAGILAPMMVGQILSFVVDDETIPGVEERTLQAWHYVFYLSAIIFAFTGAIYVFFGSNKVQKWNDPPTKESINLPSQYIKKFNDE